MRFIECGIPSKRARSSQAGLPGSSWPPLPVRGGPSASARGSGRAAFRPNPPPLPPWPHRRAERSIDVRRLPTESRFPCLAPKKRYGCPEKPSARRAAFVSGPRPPARQRPRIPARDLGGTASQAASTVFSAGLPRAPRPPGARPKVCGGRWLRLPAREPRTFSGIQGKKPTVGSQVRGRPPSLIQPCLSPIPGRGQAPFSRPFPASWFRVPWTLGPSPEPRISQPDPPFPEGNSPSFRWQISWIGLPPRLPPAHGPLRGAFALPYLPQPWLGEGGPSRNKPSVKRDGGSSPARPGRAEGPRTFSAAGLGLPRCPFPITPVGGPWPLGSKRMLTPRRSWDP